MAFDGLGDKLQDIFKRMKGQGKISEKDLKAVMREVKVALLEADVNYRVVKEFLANIKVQAMGEKILKGLKGLYTVEAVDGTLYECRTATKIRKSGIMPLAGDIAEFEVNEDKTGFIVRIEERKNSFEILMGV